jgi:hypothetical protein
MPDIMTYHAKMSVQGKQDAGDTVFMIKAELNDFYDNLEIMKNCARALCDCHSHGSDGSDGPNTVGGVINIIQEGLQAADVESLAAQGIKDVKISCVQGVRRLSADEPDFTWDDEV